MKSIGIFIAFLLVAGLVRGCQAPTAVQSVAHLWRGGLYIGTMMVVTIVVVALSCWWVGDWVDDEAIAQNDRQ